MLWASSGFRMGEVRGIIVRTVCNVHSRTAFALWIADVRPSRRGGATREMGCADGDILLACQAAAGITILPMARMAER